MTIMSRRKRPAAPAASPAATAAVASPRGDGDVVTMGHAVESEHRDDVVGHGDLVANAIEVVIHDLPDILIDREKIEWVQAIEHGVPARLVTEAAQRFGVAKERLVDVLGVSKPTLNRLAREDKVLDRVTSDVFKDAAQVLEKVLAALGGDRELMSQWLDTFNPALGCKPNALIRTKDGRELIGGVIDRARYGVFS
jgi:putative toxin-antitoxin system antitoxin component (TIGR02293 family)